MHLCLIKHLSLSRFHIPGFSAVCGHKHKCDQSYKTVQDYCQNGRCETVPLSSELLCPKATTFNLVIAGTNTGKHDAKIIFGSNS